MCMADGCLGCDCPAHKELEQERDAARTEVAALTRWKAEATAVIESWEQVHRLLGSPGRIGESKASATYDAVAGLRGVLEFYADPATYHAIAFWTDPPCGDFVEDFSEDHGDPFYDRAMPGKAAREALAPWMPWMRAEPLNVRPATYDDLP